MSFGAQLRAARNKAGLSQAAAAIVAGVSKRTWEHWEADCRVPPKERDAITQERVLSALRNAAAPLKPGN